MKPSESKRLRYMRLSSPSLMTKCFHYGAMFMALVGAVVAYVTRHVPLGIIMSIGITLLFVVIFELVAWLFVPGVMRLIRKNEAVYMISDVKIPIDDLLADAEHIELPNESWEVEVNDNWIDFTWNWRNAISLGYLTGERSVSLYKKMIKINPDYTYEELDMKYNASINASLGRIGAYKNVQYGHFLTKSFSIDFGRDVNSDNIGINTYTLNTVELADFVHCWLAERGYSRLN